ncbi:MAG: hypothetical protein D6784_05160 [Chloroflexi bacterium]|nr:MAG: hypothetical protein D6784_05160 [Chloroflexota bacterium]
MPPEKLNKKAGLPTGLEQGKDISSFPPQGERPDREARWPTKVAVEIQKQAKRPNAAAPTSVDDNLPGEHI